MIRVAGGSVGGRVSWRVAGARFQGGGGRREVSGGIKRQSRTKDSFADTRMPVSVEQQQVATSRGRLKRASREGALRTVTDVDLGRRCVLQRQVRGELRARWKLGIWCTFRGNGVR